MRVARAFRLPIIAIVTALALSGCMRTATSVAEAQPSSDLDAMAYGQSDDATAAAHRRNYAPVPVVYAAAPMPAAHDAA